MRINPDDSAARKRQLQIVRLDFSGSDGGVIARGDEIVEADDESGRVVILRHTYDDKGFVVVDAAGKPILVPVTIEYGIGTIRLTRR